LPFGTLRLRPKGSDAGHNGLKDVARVVGNENYARLRFGVGGDFPRGAQVDYVLGQFPPEEREQLPARIDVACDIIKSFCLAGIALTMNQYNKK
ncbi:MAG: aminoacyl-tRNA hydrolase, partial [Bacteroidaceae bacterium]|nr:aminoacyl-tRNA hydrolase [Bacteroidaceae bacterium]